jgi:hypothetical protein
MFLWWDSGASFKRAQKTGRNASNPPGKNISPVSKYLLEILKVSKKSFANIETLSICLPLIILTPTSDVWSNDFIKPYVVPELPCIHAMINTLYRPSE